MKTTTQRAVVPLPTSSLPVAGRFRGVSCFVQIGCLVPILLGFAGTQNATGAEEDKVENTAKSLQWVKTAVVDHYAKFGGLALDGTSTPPSVIRIDGSDGRAADFDRVLVKEQLLDKPFEPKIGAGKGRIELRQALPKTSEVNGLNAAFDLDGIGGNDVEGKIVVVAVIPEVAPEDARKLSVLVDGESLSKPNADGNDAVGRVKYSKPAPAKASGSGNSDTVTITFYLTHR